MIIPKDGNVAWHRTERGRGQGRVEERISRTGTRFCAAKAHRREPPVAPRRKAPYPQRQYPKTGHGFAPQSITMRQGASLARFPLRRLWRKTRNWEKYHYRTGTVFRNGASCETGIHRLVSVEPFFSGKTEPFRHKNGDFRSPKIRFFPFHRVSVDTGARRLVGP